MTACIAAFLTPTYSSSSKYEGSGQRYLGVVILSPKIHGVRRLNSEHLQGPASPFPLSDPPRSPHIPAPKPDGPTNSGEVATILNSHHVITRWHEAKRCRLRFATLQTYTNPVRVTQRPGPMGFRSRSGETESRATRKTFDARRCEERLRSPRRRSSLDRIISHGLNPSSGKIQSVDILYFSI